MRFFFLKKIEDSDRNCHTGQKKIFIRHNHEHEYENYLMYMTHEIKIDIFTGHEKIGNLHYFLKIIFHCILIKNHAFSQNLFS